MAIAAVPIAIVAVCLRETAAAVPVVDAAVAVLLRNNGLDPRIVYAGIGAVAFLLIVLIVVFLRGCASSAPESTPETPTATKTAPKKSSKTTEALTRTKAPTR